jgi:hypothetical protein
MDAEGIAVTLGRIEEQLKHMTEKLDRLSDQFDRDHDTLGEHGQRLAVLESKDKTARANVALWVAGVGGFVGLASLVIGFLDRFYG